MFPALDPALTLCSHACGSLSLPQSRHWRQGWGEKLKALQQPAPWQQATEILNQGRAFCTPLLQQIQMERRAGFFLLCKPALGEALTVQGGRKEQALE